MKPLLMTDNRQDLLGFFQREAKRQKQVTRLGPATHQFWLKTPPPDLLQNRLGQQAMPVHDLRFHSLDESKTIEPPIRLHFTQWSR